jgi:hypothetical protein
MKNNKFKKSRKSSKRSKGRRMKKEKKKERTLKDLICRKRQEGIKRRGKHSIHVHHHHHHHLKTLLMTSVH